MKLSEIYDQLGCNKTDMSRWEYNPCSTQLLCKKAKTAVIYNAKLLFDLTLNECENIANKAGFSLCEHKNGLKEIFEDYVGTYRNLLNHALVSERMFRYYITGKEPTKQVLLALAISMGLSLDKIDYLLHTYGYCLSRSLPNDIVVLWFLSKQNNYKNNWYLLNSINEVLYELDLPMLMTKSTKR